MKSSIYCMLTVLVLVTMPCCSKNNNDLHGNSFTLSGGTTYMITGGMYGGSTADIMIYLYNEDKSHIVGFGFHSTEGKKITGIPEGKFIYNVSETDSIKFDYGGVRSNDNDELYDFVSGTLSISKSGDAYNISFDLETEGGPLRGHYKGILMKD